MNKMNFGMPTLLELDSIEKNVLLCDELGLDFIEINMCMPEYQPGNIDETLFGRLKEQHGIEYTFHFPDHFNPFDFNPYIAEGWYRTTEQVIVLAKKLGSKIINMHLATGDYFTMPDKRIYLFDKYIEKYFASVHEFRNFCDEMIGSENITICIENCSGFTDYHKSALDILLAGNKFGLTLDIGHSRSCNFSDETFIKANSGRLRHMHIHDAIGKTNHLPLGEGELDINSYLEFGQSHTCTFVLETKTIAGLKKSVDWIKTK